MADRWYVLPNSEFKTCLSMYKCMDYAMCDFYSSVTNSFPVGVFVIHLT